VKDFLLIAPQSASGVLLDTPESSKLLSAVAIALSNCGRYDILASNITLAFASSSESLTIHCFFELIQIAYQLLRSLGNQS
jgi:hypothetical protein